MGMGFRSDMMELSAAVANAGQHHQRSAMEKFSALMANIERTGQANPGEPSQLVANCPKPTCKLELPETDWQELAAQSGGFVSNCGSDNTDYQLPAANSQPSYGAAKPNEGLPLPYTDWEELAASQQD